MGKGDKKSKKGKLWMGTFGVRRKRKKLTGNHTVASAAPVAESPKAKTKAKA